MMTEGSGFIVKWYHSLQFKLFVLMSTFLLVTTAAISFQNGSSLWNVLARTSEDSTRYAARRGAASLANLIDQWQASLHTTMHTLSLDPKRFSKHAQALLNASRDLLALNVYRVSPGAPPRLMHSLFSPYEDASNFGELGAQAVRQTLVQSDAGYAAEESSLTGVRMHALAQAHGLPAIQIQVPFPMEGSADTLVATLTIWAAKLEGLLESRSDFEALILDANGNLFLSHRDSKWTRETDIYNRLIRNLSSNGYTSSLQTDTDAEGVPIVRVASFVPSTPLVYYVERKAGKDLADMSSQTRKVALFAIGLLLIAVLASYLAAGTLSSKIRQAVSATQQIAAGNLGVVIPNSAQDEVGVLGRSVNHMAMRIRQLLEVEVAAARQEKELKTAQMVQQTFFREPDTNWQSIQVSGHFEPASECAGDWWIHIPFSPQRSLVVIADATGHGASAALIVAMAYAFFQTSIIHARQHGEDMPTPAEMLTAFNTILVASGRGKTTMTMFVAELNAETGLLRYANAGHIAPLLVPLHADDDRLKRKSNNPAKSRLNPVLGGGVMLGFESRTIFEDREMVIRPGDRVLLYTDGLIECPGADGKQLTPMDLRRMVAEGAELPGNELCHSLVRQTRQRLNGAGLEDDITIVVVEYAADARAPELPVAGAHHA